MICRAENLVCRGDRDSDIVSDDSREPDRRGSLPYVLRHLFKCIGAGGGLRSTHAGVLGGRVDLNAKSALRGTSGGVVITLRKDDSTS